MRPADWSAVELGGDPVPGDPTAVRNGGNDYIEVAQTIRRTASRLRSLSVDGVLNAIPRTPSSAACFAAASVPECQTALPRFVPRLIPDNTRSTSFHWFTPSITQSAGVPFT